MGWGMLYGPCFSLYLLLRLNPLISEITHPDIDIQELPAHVYLRSVHNVAIERAWLRLRLDWGDNAVIVFEQGKDEGIYNPDNPQQ